MDTLANLLISIKNQERVGHREAVAKPTSRLATEVLMIMQKNGYIGDFEIVDDGKGKVYKIKLLHKINDCGPISPRLPVVSARIERWEQRYLPAQGFGIVILTTSDGVMTHEEAKTKGVGGKLLAYVY